MKDFKTTGATSHSKEEREVNDFYATDPKALDLFLPNITLNNVWEPACGQGHLSEVLKYRGIHGRSSDLIDRGYGNVGINFLDQNDSWHGDILTNPPYNKAKEFCEKALSLVDDGRFIVMLMRIQFLEGKRRKLFFKNTPPKFIYVSSSRLTIAKNADFVKYNTPSANCYGWYVWEKGYLGETIIKWFN